MKHLYLKLQTDRRLIELGGTYHRDRELTRRRLAALQRTKSIKPGWAAYDPRIDEVVGIDIRIEEQEAVFDYLSDLLQEISNEQGRRLGLNQTIRMNL